jgi:hypothetical protein
MNSTGLCAVTSDAAAKQASCPRQGGAVLLVYRVDRLTRSLRDLVTLLGLPYSRPRTP